MKKTLLFLPLIFLPLLGVGCNLNLNKQETSDTAQKIEEQQKRIDELTKKIESFTTSTPSAVLLNKVKNLQPSKLNVQGTSQIGYAKFIPYVVKVVCENGSGSGTIVAPNTILTNYHVISGNTECLVGFTTSEYKTPSEWSVGKVSAIDKNLDRAVLQVNNSLANKTIRKCSVTDTKISDEIVLLGYPSVGGDTVTLTNGNISGFLGSYIKTSAKINPGNSGGAAIHKSGCYLGIPTAYVKDAEALGYIIDERTGSANSTTETLQQVGPDYEKDVAQQKDQEKQAAAEQYVKDTVADLYSRGILKNAEDERSFITFAAQTKDTDLYHAANAWLEQKNAAAKQQEEATKQREAAVNALMQDFENQLQYLKNNYDTKISHINSEIASLNQQFNDKMETARTSGYYSANSYARLYNNELTILNNSIYDLENQKTVLTNDYNKQLESVKNEYTIKAKNL